MESDEQTAAAIVALLLVKKIRKREKDRVGKTLAGEENYSWLVWDASTRTKI